MNDLQRDFTQDFGWTDLIFEINANDRYFIAAGSCTYTAALDLSKAFDGMSWLI
jgi:hypothetical protein